MQLINELRLGSRALARVPVFSSIIILLLAIGIGANVLIFSVVDHVLLEPLPFPDGDRLVQIWETGENTNRGPLSLHNIVELQNEAKTLEGVAAYGYESFTIDGEEGVTRISGLATTTNFFDVLGAGLVRGRGFRANEGGLEKSPVAVISEGFWRRRFAGTESITGETMILNGRTIEIIGVAKDRGAFGSIDIWVPLVMDLDEAKRGHHYLFGLARLGEGSTLASATSEVGTIGKAIAERYGSDVRSSFRLVPLREEWYGQLETPLYVLFATVATVLLIVCANVAGLMLARSAGRRREIAIRAALGAGRRRLVRQFLIEGLLLAGAAGIAGTAFAGWGLDALGGALPAGVGQGLGIDLSVVVFAVAVTLTTATVFSLAPVVHTLRSDVMSSLRLGGVHESPSLRTAGRSVFVVLQFSFAIVLLVAATLLARSLADLWSRDPGFDPSNSVTMRVALGDKRFDDPREVIRVQRRILDELRSIGSIEHVGLVSDLPFSGSRSSSSFRIVGNENYLTADRREASDGYFGAMGMAILEGRALSAEDDLSRPRVAVINEKMASQLWPGESAIGKRIVIGSPEEFEIEGMEVEREVVGVVSSIVHDNLGAEPAMEMYLSSSQLPSRRIFIAIRSTEKMETLLPSVREAVRRADPLVAVYGIQTMSERLARSLRRNTIVAYIVGSFSVLALFLSVIGLYGLVSHVVAQRTREFGVRRALGANSATIVLRVIREGSLLAAAGTVAGIGASLFLMRFLRGLLSGVRPDDPLTLVSVSALLAVVTVTACAIPAMRASSVEVMEALREE